MLTIRSEQIAVLDNEAEEKFLLRLTAAIRKCHGSAVVRLPAKSLAVQEIPQPALTGMVRKGIDRARSYGFIDETSLAGFVALMFLVAPNFNEHPEIHKALSDKSVAPDLRLERMWLAINDETWAEAERSCKPTAWNLET